MPSLKSILLLLTALLAGCGTTAATLGYSPTEAPRPRAAPIVSVVTVTDARREKDPTYIGAIRGGFGNPLKTLTSARPVKDEVAAAFEAALQARNLYGPNAPAALAVTLTELSANQVARRRAHEIQPGPVRPRNRPHPVFGHRGRAQDRWQPYHLRRRGVRLHRRFAGDHRPIAQPSHRSGARQTRICRSRPVEWNDTIGGFSTVGTDLALFRFAGAAGIHSGKAAVP